MRTGIKINTHKGTYYSLVVDVSVQEIQEIDSDTTNDDEQNQVKMCMAKFVEKQPFLSSQLSNGRNKRNNTLRNQPNNEQPKSLVSTLLTLLKLMRSLTNCLVQDS